MWSVSLQMETYENKSEVTIFAKTKMKQISWFRIF